MPKQKPLPEIASWSEVDQALVRLCQIQANREKFEAAVNERIAALRATFGLDVNDLAQEEAQLRRDVERFCRERQAEFAPAKSVERLHAVLSFRTTPPAVRPFSRSWLAGEILEAVKKLKVYGRQFVRVAEDLDKEAILAAHRDGKLTDEQLADAGLRIVQREQFDIDLKRETAPEARE